MAYTTPVFREPHLEIGSAASAVLDAADERTVMFGRVGAWHWTQGSKQITAVRQCVNTKVNGTGTTTVRVSLRDPDLTSSPPARDDGVVDQFGTVDITALTDFTQFTVTLDTARTVNIGDYLCVVTDFSAFGTGPSLQLRHWRESDGGRHMPACSSYTGGTWANVGGLPSVALICSDGSEIYLTMDMTAGCNEFGFSSGYNSASVGTTLGGGDEHGCLWVPRKPWLLYGGRMNIRCDNVSGSGQIRLYRDTTVLHTEELDVNTFAFLSAGGHYYYTFPTPILVNPGDNIRHTLTPGNDINWRDGGLTVSTTTDLIAYFGGDKAESLVSYTQRVDEGAWEFPTKADRTIFNHQLYGTPLIPAVLVNQPEPQTGRVVILGTSTTSDEITVTSQTTSSKSHTVPSGSERLVVRTFGSTVTPDPSGSVPTFNGVNLTLVGSSWSSTYNHFSTIWELASPSFGTHTLSVPHVSRDANANVGLMWVATNLANLNTTTPRRTVATVLAEPGTASISVTSSLDDLVLFTVGQNGGVRTPAEPFWYTDIVPGAYGSNKVGLTAFGPGEASSKTATVQDGAGQYSALVGVAYVPRPETHTISGTVKVAGVAVGAGHPVRLINQVTHVVRHTTTDANGAYSFTVETGYLYHAVAEVNISGQRYNYRSLFDLTPV